ncbi:MAG: hypothetical protein WC831_00600 [Parcubacteria group bacterium]|jgi:hypothetical protein
METKNIKNYPILQENSAPGEISNLEIIKNLATEAGIRVTDDQVARIAGEIVDKKKILANIEKETGRAAEFSEDDFIKGSVAQIKKTVEFKASYMAALALYKEIWPDGVFYKFNMEDPMESLGFTQRTQGKEEGRFFFSTIVQRLKNIKEVLGAPVKKGTRCFMVIVPDHIKEFAIGKIDKNGRITMIDHKGAYNQNIYRTADDAINYLKEKYADKLEGKEIKVEDIEDKE